MTEKERIAYLYSEAQEHLPTLNKIIKESGALKDDRFFAFVQWMIDCYMFKECRAENHSKNIPWYYKDWNNEKYKEKAAEFIKSL